MKKFFNYIFTFILMVIVAWGALYIVSYIPNVLIKNNAKISAEQLKKEKDQYYIKSYDKKILFHNSTDAIMLNIIYGMDYNDKIDSIMKGRRNYIPGVKQKVLEDTNGNLLAVKNVSFNMVREYARLLDNDETQEVFEYVRYWHGYIVILRILLVFIDIFEIRLLLQIILYALIGFLMFALIKNKKVLEACLILIGYFVLDVATWVNNIQGIFVMLVSLCISIGIAMKKINNDNLPYALFVTGGIVAYLDFLTVPLVSLMLPVIIHNIVRDEEDTLKDIVVLFIKSVVAWGIGYIGLWASKWVIADLIYGTDIVKLSIQQILVRMGIVRVGYEVVTKNLGDYIVGALINNLYYLKSIITYIVFVPAVIISVVYGIKNGFKVFFNKDNIIYYFVFLSVYAWYIVCANHSWQHFFFTYRLQLVSVIALLMISYGSIIKNISIKTSKEDKG